MITKSIILVTFLINYGNSSPVQFPFDSNSNSDFIDVKLAVHNLNNIKGRTWTAAFNGFGEYFSPSEQKHRMGSFTLDNKANGPSDQIPINEETPVPVEAEKKHETHIYSDDELPENYDARTMYPHCSTISSVRDQSLCGCCWAASTAAAFSDRLCIHSKGMINVNISINHIMSCTKSANGCHGGWEHDAWNFLKNNGVVTGGDYGSFDGCQPYPVKPCGKNYQMPCSPDGSQVLTPMCRNRKCSNEWHEPEGQIYKVKSTWQMGGNYTHPNKEIDIRREIYRNGPVTAAFKVYWPFYLYKSGIFQMDLRNWNLPNGGHAVRIVGWGVENKIPYWIIANSWGKNWGENGFFRMLRGKNFCRIESYINSGIPDVPQDTY